MKLPKPKKEVPGPSKDEPVKLTPEQYAINSKEELNIGWTTIIRSIEGFSNKQLIRIIKHLIFTPYKKIKFKDEKEENFANLANYLMMRKLVFKQSEQKALQKEKENESSVQKTKESQGGVSVDESGKTRQTE